MGFAAFERPCAFELVNELFYFFVIALFHFECLWAQRLTARAYILLSEKRVWGKEQAEGPKMDPKIHELNKVNT